MEELEKRKEEAVVVLSLSTATLIAPFLPNDGSEHHWQRCHKTDPQNYDCWTGVP